MITLAQRIMELRTERGISRPALSAALGLPKLAAEKFETGRQTPTQAQQKQLADFFGVSVSYLRGESRDRTRMDDWLSTAPPASETDTPAAAASRRPQPTPTAQAKQENMGGGTGVLGSFVNSPQFQEVLHTAVWDVLHTEEGENFLVNLIRKELGREK